MRRRALVVPALAALVLAGCGTHTSAGSGGGTGTQPTTAMPAMSMPATGTPDAGTGAPVATTTVHIQNFAFSPAVVTVTVGATVTWANRDEDAHTVTARDRSFASPTLTSGQSFSHTFRTPGRYAYLCTIHPFMTAVVVVTA